MIRVGDTIKRRIALYDPGHGSAMIETDVEAEVVYIHPERRYYVVRCEMPGGRSFREALYFFPRCGMYEK